MGRLLDLSNDFLFLISLHIILDFITFAQIEITKRGFRRLYLDGYSFGESSRQTEGFLNRVHWRCTNSFVNSLNKRQRCKTYLTTELINGYEMIKSKKNNVHHH